MSVLRGNLHLGTPLQFRNPCRNRSAPIEWLVYALRAREPNDPADALVGDAPNAPQRLQVRTTIGRGRIGPVDSCAKRMERSAWEQLSPSGLHDPALVALPVAILFVGALV